MLETLLKTTDAPIGLQACDILLLLYVLKCMNITFQILPLPPANLAKISTSFTSLRFRSSAHLGLEPVTPAFYPAFLDLTIANIRLRPCEMIRNVLRFNCEELLASPPNPKLEYHILSAVRDCLFKTFAATLPTGSLWTLVVAP